jgi:hypothetical protein
MCHVIKGDPKSGVGSTKGQTNIEIKEQKIDF